MATAAPTTTAPGVPAPRVTSRPATFLQVLAVAVVLGILGWLAVQVFVIDATISSQSAVSDRIDESAELERLVRTGQVPAAAYDAETEATRRLTARGLLPSTPARATTASVDEAAETARLVATGLVPGATMEPGGEQTVTRSLIDRGLVPSGSLR